MTHLILAAPLLLLAAVLLLTALFAPGTLAGWRWFLRAGPRIGRGSAIVVAIGLALLGALVAGWVMAGIVTSLVLFVALLLVVSGVLHDLLASGRKPPTAPVPTQGLGSRAAARQRRHRH